MEKQQFQADLERCKQLMLAGQFADALVIAKQLLEQDEENLLLHLLLATLYARNNQLLEALPHYMLLCQFDPGFELAHCLELARGYHTKGHADMAAVLAHAGAVKLESKELYQLAADCYEQSGSPEQAKKMREQIQ